MHTITNTLRTKVSGDKHRFKDGTFDLDLTYITDRIIAMSFPAEGMVEGTYRNRMEKVVGMLEAYHKDHYCVFNLTRREYDASRFYKSRFCGWPDHTAPPLALLLSICKEIDDFLAKDHHNVVVVHCLAGKGRTGTVIASYLLYCGLFSTALEAMDFFAARRSSNNWGVCVPSQRRYVTYVARIVYQPKAYLNHSTPAMVLREVILSCLPGFDAINGCAPMVAVVNCSDPSDPVTVFEADSSQAMHENAHSHAVSLPVFAIVRGDVIVYLKHASILRPTTMLTVQFHTGMLRSKQLVVKKGNCDIACNDRRFCHDFFVQLMFEPMTSSAAQEACAYREPDWRSTTAYPGGVLPFVARNPEGLEEKIKEARAQAHPEHSGTADRGGWLVKQGDTFKQWKNRWVVLKSDALSYYKTPKHTSPAGSIPLPSIIHVSPGQERKDSFDVVCTDRIHKFGAHDHRERDEWIEAIDCARLSLGESRVEAPRAFSVADFDLGVQAMQLQVLAVEIPKQLGTSWRPASSCGVEMATGEELRSYSIKVEIAGKELLLDNLSDEVYRSIVMTFDDLDLQTPVKLSLLHDAHGECGIAEVDVSRFVLDRPSVTGPAEAWLSFKQFEAKQEEPEDPLVHRHSIMGRVVGRAKLKTTLLLDTHDSDYEDVQDIDTLLQQTEQANASREGPATTEDLEEWEIL